jgi:uncharacterized peroxidase-related enzyme
VTHHRRGLRRLLKDDQRVSRIESDYLTADLEQRQTAMLRYAEKLTRRPSDVAKADVDALRKVGFDDGDILAIAEVTAYYAYANRIADGLGVQVEPWFEPE